MNQESCYGHGYGNHFNSIDEILEDVNFKREELKEKGVSKENIDLSGAAIYWKKITSNPDIFEQYPIRVNKEGNITSVHAEQF